MYMLLRSSPLRALAAALKPALSARALAGPRVTAALTASTVPARSTEPSMPHAAVVLALAPAFSVRSMPATVSWVAPDGAIEVSQVAALAGSLTEATIRTPGDVASVPSIENPIWPPNHGLISVEKSCLLSVSRLTSRSRPSSALASKLVWSAKPGNFERNASRFARWSPGMSARISA